MNDISVKIKEDIRQNELITVKEVACYLRVSRVTVWRWCRQGMLPASRVGRNWLIRRDDLLHLLEMPQSSDLPSVDLASTVENSDGTQSVPIIAMEGNSDEDAILDRD